MTREEAKTLLPIIKAYAKGKTIEVRNPNIDDDKWKETNYSSFNPSFDYRIKPEPKYRPFKNAMECMAEMNNHKPFGWVSQKNVEDDDPIYLQICGVQDDSIFFYDSREGEYYEDALNNYVFLDGSPFGIKKE